MQNFLAVQRGVQRLRIYRDDQPARPRKTTAGAAAQVAASAGAAALTRREGSRNVVPQVEASGQSETRPSRDVRDPGPRAKRKYQASSVSDADAPTTSSKNSRIDDDDSDDDWVAG